MSQFNFDNNILNLRVKKSPFLVRGTMFLLAFSFFILPIGAAIFGIVLGSGLHIGYFNVIGICFLIGFYTLRVSLWNTYGEEIIQIFENRIIYEANYVWFKDGKKETVIINPHFYAVSAGYEKDNEGVLVISSDDVMVESVVKMPITQLEQLVNKLSEKDK